jgi:TonB-linked SusC/RagA family outer membrane protein
MAKSSLQKLTVAILFLLIAASNVIAQSRTVTGRVTNATGEPLGGATITVVGSQAGTSAGTDGNFSIAVPARGTIRISAIGYAEQEVRITNQTTINAVLQPSNAQLEQVVVVGYGTQRKEAVTGSVASVSGNVMREVPSTNVTQALQGRLAGVDIAQTSTRPGANMQIRIRGTRSLSADNNPLIVLDGIPFVGSLADLNPNDIKSVDVLKDASATAIYGSRGANGVILVTTEKGARGRKPRISYNSFNGTQQIFAKYPMMNGPEFIKLRAAGGMFTNGPDESNDINTDWQDLFYRTGYISDHNISVSGGTESGGNYNFGGGYHVNQGVVPTQQFKRYTLRGSLDQQVGKNFVLGLQPIPIITKVTATR